MRRDAVEQRTRWMTGAEIRSFGTIPGRQEKGVSLTMARGVSAPTCPSVSQIPR